MNITDMLNVYIRACRYRKTLNTLFFVTFGAYLGSTFGIGLDILWKVLLIYLVFGILLYGGIYALNESSDITYDTFRKNLLSNKTSYIPFIKIMATISILVGYAFVLVALPKLSSFYLGLLIINLIYTFILKRVSMLFATLLIATTGPLKLLLGVYISYGLLNSYIVIALLHYAFSVCFHSIKNYSRLKLPLNQRNVLLITFFFLGNLLMLYGVFLQPFAILLFYFFGIANVLISLKSGNLLDYYKYEK